MPARYQLIELDLGESDVILEVLKFLLHVKSFADARGQVRLIDQLLKVTKIILIASKLEVLFLNCVGLAINRLYDLRLSFVLFAIGDP